MNWLEITDIGKPRDDVDYVSKWPLLAHMVSAALCMGFSAIYHLFFVYSPKVYKVLA